MFPADEHGPGAVEIGAVTYLDRVLNGAYADLRETYRLGLAALDRACVALHGSPLADLDAATQDAVIADMEGRRLPGFAVPDQWRLSDLLRAHMQEGVFADPSYGGNVGCAGWRAIGHPGVWLENSAEENLCAEPVTKGRLVQSLADVAEALRADTSPDPELPGYDPQRSVEPPSGPVDVVLVGVGAVGGLIAPILAGATMGHRFDEEGMFLRSFVAPESTFIDIMMNVGIIFHAARELGDADLLRKATEHCLTTRRYLVRGDGSTAHEGLFDLETGEFLRQSTHQGWRGDSSWARGQGWALYGFGTAYRFTHDPRFLDTAQRCADFFVASTDEGGVPPNDWMEPSPVRRWESSAAAIAASGLLQLAELTRSGGPGVPADSDRADGYLAAARRTMDTLLTPEFLAVDTPGWEGILKHGSYHERLDLGVDESVMWGEYFFVEALDKLLGADALS